MDMKMYSNTLQKEFDLAVYESEDSSSLIIAHEALENLAHNELPFVQKDFRYDLNLIHSQTSPVMHFVFKCVIADGNGRRVEAIGEVMPATLNTDIARDYPALCASQRAFDRALLRYLGFPGKCFSSVEGVPQKQEQPPAEEPKAPPAPPAKPPARTPARNQQPAPAQPTQPTSNAATGGKRPSAPSTPTPSGRRMPSQRTPSPTAAASPSPTPSAPASRQPQASSPNADKELTELANTTIRPMNGGGQTTIGDMYANDRDTFIKLATNGASSAAMKARKYMKLMEGGN